jgi:hypothetical protein
MYILISDAAEVLLKTISGREKLKIFLLVVNVSEMSLQVAADGKANLEIFLLVVNVSGMSLQVLEIEKLT